MCTTKHLLYVLMDDITDSNKLIEFAEKETNPDIANWFMKKAKQRIECMMNTYEDVEDVLKIEETAKTNDYAGAVLHHIKEQMNMLKGRL